MRKNIKPLSIIAIIVGLWFVAVINLVSCEEDKSHPVGQEPLRKKVSVTPDGIKEPIRVQTMRHKGMDYVVVFYNPASSSAGTSPFVVNVTLDSAMLSYYTKKDTFK